MSPGLRVARVWWWRAGLLALAVLAWVLSGWLGAAPRGAVQGARALALVVPDGLSLDDPHVQAWEDAAAELGFKLRVVKASGLLRPGGEPAEGALIVPDQIHRRMNDATVAALEQRVQAGAQLLLVHDAGVEDLAGGYHPVQSRLSGLAGVSYARFGELGAHMAGEQVAWVAGDAVAALRLPPGKLVREDADAPLSSHQPPPARGEALALLGYQYGRLTYPAFRTRGRFDGRRLMHAQDGGLLAGEHVVGAGRVLFVNLPLTYLKLRTDGLLLHAFLHHFAQDLAGLAQLSPVPDATGALVMNWHVDSAAAVPAIAALDSLGVFAQGPYSIHLTAGPDVDIFGDGMGMDLDRNPAMQQWARRFVARGDEVGSHGGWIHNAFGRDLETWPTQRAIERLERNIAAVHAASGRLVREYSAPLGNHPAWVTQWLAEHGIRSYYFTGDIGMAPTRSFQGGRRGPAGMWAYPVLSYGADASFEETASAGASQDEVAAWLIDVADFCADQGTVRLVYFHPPGVALFPQAFRRWLAHTGRLIGQGELRWTTMAAQTAFANERLSVQWDIQASGGTELLQARHPRTLAHHAWLLPVWRYGAPVVLQGQAEITRKGDAWHVVAGPSSQLRLRLPPRTEIRTSSASSPALAKP